MGLLQTMYGHSMSFGHSLTLRHWLHPLLKCSHTCQDTILEEQPCVSILALLQPVQGPCIQVTSAGLTCLGWLFQACPATTATGTGCCPPPLTSADEPHWAFSQAKGLPIHIFWPQLPGRYFLAGVALALLFITCF